MRKNEQGIAHVIEIVIISVVIIGVGIFIWWRTWGSRQATPTANSAVQQAIANANCPGVTDHDLCKFLTGWKASTQFSVKSTQTADGKTSTSTFESSNGGSNYHMILTVSDTPYEIIGIGKTIYTKDTKDNSWWKQTQPTTDESKLKGDYNYDFKEPSTDSKTPAAQQPTYKKIGMESCGNLQCFKYQVIDPAASDQTQYIWFDNQDYQLRRLRNESKNGDSSDQTFIYANVNISAPSPTKDLAPNQYIVPGQSDPVTVPSASDLQNVYQTTE